MKCNLILTLLFILTFGCISGQTNKTDIQKQKVLADFTSKLNGIWNSETDSDKIKFIVSKNTFQGQLLFPYEEVQQVGPIKIKLDQKADGKIILLKIFQKSRTDTSDIQIIDNKLMYDNMTFVRHKK